MNKSTEGLPEYFHPVVLKHGRDMFDLVMNAGMAQQAAETLVKANGRVPALMHATGLLAQGFNQVSNMLAAAKGWTEAELAACDQELKLAFAGRIEVPDTRIILTH